MVSTARTSLLRTQQAAHSLTQDAPFQFLEQFIIRAQVCVSAHITCILLQRGSGFEPGVLSSCGQTTVITPSASRIEHPSRKRTRQRFNIKSALTLHERQLPPLNVRNISDGPTADITKSGGVVGGCPDFFQIPN